MKKTMLAAVLFFTITELAFFMNGWTGGGGPGPAGQSVLQGGGLGDQETPMGGMWHCWTPEWAEFMRGER